MSKFKSQLLTSLFSLTLALSGTAVDAAAKWQILVQDQLTAGSKDTPAKWVTVWADGTSTKRMDGLVADLSGKMCTLKVATSKERGATKTGKFPFVYEIDQLTAQPVAGGQAKVLLGDSALTSAKALMHEHLNECEGMKPLPFAPDTTESYEKSKVRILAVYSNSLAVDQASESFKYGRPNPMSLSETACYKLDKDCATTGKKALPAALAVGDASKFSKLPPGEPEASFVAKNPKLVPWDKVQFYTVSPDKTAVVYAQNGMLFWQAATGKPKPLGSVKSVHGWQWRQ